MATKLVGRWVGLVVALVLVAVAGCSSDDTPEAQPTTTRRATSTTPVAQSGALAVIRGEATLDGKPFDAQWVGAVVLRDGLVTPCQYALPPVENGKYSVPVWADGESTGCGADGSSVVLWTYANDKIVFSSEDVAWPGSGRTTTFAARYDSTDPDGAAPVTAQFNGAVLGKNRNALPAGTKVEAFVGTTRCGVASVRQSDEFTGYILAVVGPDSIPGCTRGAPLEFRIDGQPAAKTSAVNTPPGRDGSLDLVQQ